MDNAQNVNKISKDFFELIMHLHKNVIRPDDFIKNLSIPPSHVKVIFYLAQNGSCSVSNIARDLCISKSNMTPILDKLLDLGYITRCEDPDDRRVILIKVTPKAHEAFKMKNECVINFLSQKFSSLNESELNLLEESITNLNEIILKL